MNMAEYYAARISPLEPKEFSAWFEMFYGQAMADPALYDMYLSERRFALLGWLAARLPQEQRIQVFGAFADVLAELSSVSG